MGYIIRKTAKTELETLFGTFRFFVFQEKNKKDISQRPQEHIVLIKSWDNKIPLVRIHSECATGDIFASQFCDCRLQLHEALKRIHSHGGIVIYLKQEGRGLGLSEKIRAYELQRKGFDTVEANRQLGREGDEREYDLAVEILREFKVKKLRLLTNNPNKIKALEEKGFSVEREALQLPIKSLRGKKYLKTKKEKLGHLI